MSEDGKYRYTLWRCWAEANEPERCVAFIGLNPSTADANKDDPTIRRCIAFAKAWGYNKLLMVNLFAFRATDPSDMKKAEDPIGPQNQFILESVELNADLVVLAWGAHGDHAGQNQVALGYINNPHHLGLTKAGHPRHPLYLKSDVKPQPFFRSFHDADFNG